MNQFLHFHKTIEDSFGAGRTAGHINIYRNDLVNALQHRISVKDATTAGTSTNSNHPPWLSHLKIHLLNDRTHLLCNSTHYQEYITLPRRKAHPFSTKPRKVVMAGSRSHKFNSTTTRCER